MRAGKARVSIENGQILRAAQPLFDARARLADDPVLTRLDLRQIDADFTRDMHAVIGSVPRDVRRTRAGHISLGRRAADIHTGAAEFVAFDDGRFAALARET